jgi:hypothetical protein
MTQREPNAGVLGSAETSRVALSEREASALGCIVAGQLGDEPTVEQLTAQRLRLARAFAPRRERLGLHFELAGPFQNVGRWVGTRTTALALGSVAAVVVVGVGLGLGKIRSKFEWAEPRAVGLSAEPMRAAQKRDQDTSERNVQTGTWRNRGRGVVVADGWLQADAEPVHLDWVQADNSKRTNSVRLEPGTRARVLNVNDDRLVLSLEHGRVVVDGDGTVTAPCEVFAGPYLVHSNEATYEVSWSTDTRSLVLDVQKGQALLEENKAVEQNQRPVGRGLRQVVSAGQRVELGEPQRESRTRRELDSKLVPNHNRRTPASRGSVSEPVRVEKQATAPQVLPTRPGSQSPTDIAADGGSWKTLAESGKYREAITAAKAAGFDAVQATASPSDLLLLADAARLGGAPNQARATLQLLRQNFPTHTNAAIAAFTLGRMAQELDHNDRAALKWYRTYLSQEPQGRMAEGARARVLKGALRVGTSEEVQAAARDYLSHHPSGSSAALARQAL